jgi:hypothetical protein
MEHFQGSAQHVWRDALSCAAQMKAREQQMLDAALKLVGAGCIAQPLKARSGSQADPALAVHERLSVRST